MTGSAGRAGARDNRAAEGRRRQNRQRGSKRRGWRGGRRGSDLAGAARERSAPAARGEAQKGGTSGLEAGRSPAWRSPHGANLTDGTIHCWGNNTSGQLGDGVPLSGFRRRRQGWIAQRRDGRNQGGHAQLRDRRQRRRLVLGDNVIGQADGNQSLAVTPVKVGAGREGPGHRGRVRYDMRAVGRRVRRRWGGGERACSEPVRTPRLSPPRPSPSNSRPASGIALGQARLHERSSVLTCGKPTVRAKDRERNGHFGPAGGHELDRADGRRWIRFTCAFIGIRGVFRGGCVWEIGNGTTSTTPIQGQQECPV